MKRPPWLKTNSTGAEVHGVQRNIIGYDTKYAMLVDDEKKVK